MNIKIQGGGSGTYANTGSCTGVTTYLQHEDLERMKNGREVQPFFNNSRDYISAQEVTFKIDNNKAKLSRNDAKFYVITVSPSSRELEKMGKTEKEQAEAMRKYVRDDVMQHYAEGFGKGLNKEDIEYYGKIHFERKGADRYDMHAHIIVSRKDRSNTRKLSPKTNHTGKKNCGNVKGGFDRTDFFRKCESSFDKRTGYDRAPEQTFDYLNTMKNGSPKEIFQKKEWAERVNHERLEKMKAEWSRDLQEPRREQRGCNHLRGGEVTGQLQVQPPALQADFHKPAQKRCDGCAYHRRGGNGRKIGHEFLGIHGVALRQYRPVGQGETGKADRIARRGTQVVQQGQA